MMHIPKMQQVVAVFLVCAQIPIATNSTMSIAQNNTSSSPPPKPWYWLSQENQKRLIIATMSVTSTGALLNLVVIFAIAIDPLKILRKRPWVSILNLAIADLISSISWFYIWGTIYLGNNEILTVIANFLWGFGITASFLWLTFFAVQVFITIKFPRRSSFGFSSLEIAMVAIAIWIFAILSGFSHITWHFKLELNTSIKIWAAAIGVLQIAVLVQIVLNILVIMEIIRSGRAATTARNMGKHKNIATTVVILTLVLFVTAFPYFVFKQLEYLSRLGYFGQGKTGGVLFFLSYCYAPIAVLNFAANPILYALRLPEYRRTLFAFVGKKIRCRGKTPSTTSSNVTSDFSLQIRNSSNLTERPSSPGKSNYGMQPE